MTPPYDVILSGPVEDTPECKQRFAVALVAQKARRRTFAADGTPNPISVWIPSALEPGRPAEWYLWQGLDAIRDSPKCVLVQMAGWAADPRCVAEYAVCMAAGRAVADE